MSGVKTSGQPGSFQEAVWESPRKRRCAPGRALAGKTDTVMAVEHDGFRAVFSTTRGARVEIEYCRTDAMGITSWVPPNYLDDATNNARLRRLLVALARGEAKVYRSDDPKAGEAMSIRYSARNSAGEVVELRRHARGAWGKPSSDLVVTHGPAGAMMKVALESRTVALDLARALTELASELPDDTGIGGTHNP